MAQAPADAPHPSETADRGHAPVGRKSGANGYVGFFTLMLGSIGVVYGDIGTSPLYAFKESLAHVMQDGTPATMEEVYGIVSLIFWALMIVVTLKYVLLVMQMDNKGEGGTLSLMALAQRALGRRTAILFIIGVAGASMFYGDALITPAISVLSAVEGLRAVPALAARIDPFILPIGVGVLIGLFAVQARGTATVGRFFGPIMLVWFSTMGAIGAMHVAQHPGIVVALSPVHALGFMVSHGFLTFVVLGSVFLAVTGAEALYADMGHFGRRPIRVAWIFILPALTLNYLGQGAYVINHLDAVNRAYSAARVVALAAGEKHVTFNFTPFFEMAPDMIRLPLVVLATAATVIASQAVISGAYSLTQQAIQLGLLPRMEIRRTSETQAGQIYMPQINWILLAGVLVLALAFGSSTRLAAAYGISITGEMLMSTCMAFIVIWRLWKKPLWAAAAIMAPFALIELIFLSSNLQRVLQGGFVPLLLAGGLMLTFWTWVRGTRLLAENTRRDEPLAKLFETLSHHPPHRVRGAAIFLTGDPDVAPAALMHNLKHNQVLHERLILLHVATLDQPRASRDEILEYQDLGEGLHRVTLKFGFAETPDVPKALKSRMPEAARFQPGKATYFLGRETYGIGKHATFIDRIRLSAFEVMARNASPATAYFQLPPGRVVELGAQITL